LNRDRSGRASTLVTVCGQGSAMVARALWSATLPGRPGLNTARPRSDRDSRRPAPPCSNPLPGVCPWPGQGDFTLE